MVVSIVWIVVRSFDVKQVLQLRFVRINHPEVYTDEEWEVVNEN